MREYKFRAWDKINEEMINWEQYKGEMVSDDFEYDDLIIMQWTGAKDINSKDIYIGDIIRYPTERNWENENFTSYIVWFDDRPEWGIGYKLRAQFHGALCGGYVESNLKNANKMLKIGNIFENPELVKEDIGRYS